MRLLNKTFPTPEENLACDEVLLNLCEGGSSGEVLRFWKPQNNFVVLGSSCRHLEDVDMARCRDEGIPVLRRCSGGGTVFQGPGCLNYSLVLQISGIYSSIGGTNQFIMGKHRTALAGVLKQRVEIQGFTDLTIGTLKFSGNSQRRRQRALLFHGTFLLDLNIPLLENYLKTPQKQPSYRLNRSHGDFLTNLLIPAEPIQQALQRTWLATATLDPLPIDPIIELAQKKYREDSWNFRF